MKRILENKMRIITLFISLVLIIGIPLAFLYGFKSAKAPMVSANCSNGRLTINLYKTETTSMFAVRVDNKKNNWKPDKANQGDYFSNKYKKDEYVAKAEFGGQYNYWVHSINRFNIWSNTSGGPISCPLPKPVSVKTAVDYKTGLLNIEWNNVDDANKYAVRVDDNSNPFTPLNLQRGDIITDAKENKFSFYFKSGRNYNIWLHAIDKYGVWSDASSWQTIKVL